jgi:hypothetical protein
VPADGLALLGEIDDAHAALTEYLDDGVRTNVLRMRCRRRRAGRVAAAE